MSLQCYILSGISGAGKSTWIQNQPWAKNADIHSSDDHFIQLDGSYLFDFTKLQEAHNVCLLKFLRGIRNGYAAMQKGVSLEDQPIQVVDNTNLTSEEISPYYNIARAHGYGVTLVNLLISAEEAAERNQHKVPLNTIQNMQQKLRNRKLPNFWKFIEENYMWTDAGWVRI